MTTTPDPALKGRRGEGRNEAAMSERIVRMEPQPPADAKITFGGLDDRAWWADSPSWNPWFGTDSIAPYQLPMVIWAPADMPGARPVQQGGVWAWSEKEGGEK